MTYDLEALDILKGLLRRTSRGDALEAYFTDFKQRFGVRPTASEIHHAGFDPRASGHGGWFQFVKRQGDLQADEDRALKLHQDFLDELSRTPMTRSYKMILIKVMQAGAAFPGSMRLDDLATGFQDFAFRNPRIAADIGAPANDFVAIRTSVRTNPIDAWSKRVDSRGHPFFTFADSLLRTGFDVAPELRRVFNAMVAELVDWRLAKYLGRGERPDESNDGFQPSLAVEGTADAAATSAVAWREYMRERIPPLFGLGFKRGFWNQGFVVDGRHACMLVTLKKANLQSGRRYEDRFLNANTFQWSSQSKTQRGSTHGRIINQTELGYDIHLFVRAEKLRGGKGAPFHYCGEVDFKS